MSRKILNKAYDLGSATGFLQVLYGLAGPYNNWKAYYQGAYPPKRDAPLSGEVINIYDVNMVLKRIIDIHQIYAKA